jgi:hypothetical protein
MQKTFDCQKKKYLEVQDQFENWLLTNQHDRPLHVITGRNKQLKDLVINEVKKYDFKVSEWHYNPGLIIIL